MEQRQNGPSDEIPTVTVDSDDEKTVDKQIKQQILNLRSVVDDDERRLYVDRIQENPDYTRQDANRDWGLSIRQYLRGIKRLWSDQEDVPIRNVNFYWKELPLHKEPLRVPPPDTRDYQFSLVQYGDEYDDRELREAIGLPRGTPLPEIHTERFIGLQSILNKNKIEHTWIIKTDARGPPPNHETERVGVRRPIPKHILENAVEAADNFLQQAGLGFDIEVPAYTGDEGPGV